MVKYHTDSDGDLEAYAVIRHLELKVFQVEESCVWEFAVSGNLGKNGWSEESTGFGFFQTMKLLQPYAMEIKKSMEKNGVKHHTFADSEKRRTRIYGRYIKWIRHKS